MKNGLYSIHIKWLDGTNGLATGIIILVDGAVFGGDPFYYYTGSYSCKDGRIKGEMVNRPHTPGASFFGGREVGIGFSGTYRDNRAEMSGISFVGKRSISMRLTMRKLADA